MKGKSLNLILLVSLLSGLISCSPSPEAPTSALTTAIDSLKALYAPDRRLAVFDVACVQQGSAVIVRGEVDNPKAKDDVMSLVRNRFGGQTIDSLMVLPDSQLGEKRYGIVSVSVGNVRSNPRHPAELSCQIMMGMAVRLLKKHGEWYYVQLPDDYLGWLESSAMRITTERGIEAWKSPPLSIVTAYFGFVRERPTATAQPVSDAVAGMLVRHLEMRGTWVAVELPDGRKGYIDKSSVDSYDHWKKTRKLTPENIEVTARSLIGVPYLWGGTSPKGMDCSGFTKTVFRLNGLELRRDASQQATGGDVIEQEQDLANLKKGDLLFFGRRATANRAESITHVGIYLSNMEFVHSSSGGASVKINSFDSLAPHYRGDLLRSYIRARRYIGSKQIPEVSRK